MGYKEVVLAILKEIEEEIKITKKLIQEEPQNKVYLIGRLQSYQWIHLLLKCGKIGSEEKCSV